MKRSGYPFAAMLLTGALAAGSEAAAQEFCVACTGPDALYRCVIDGAKPRGGQPLQMLCVTTMAKQGGHATCAVKGGTVFECDGQVKRVPWAPVGAAAQPPPPPSAAAATQPAAKPAASPDAPPQTMVDLAKQANEKAAEQVKKAGEATKKTWECMFSLFTRC